MASISREFNFSQLEAGASDALSWRTPTTEHRLIRTTGEGEFPACGIVVMLSHSRVASVSRSRGQHGVSEYLLLPRCQPKNLRHFPNSTDAYYCVDSFGILSDPLNVRNLPNTKRMGEWAQKRTSTCAVCNAFGNPQLSGVPHVRVLDPTDAFSRREWVGLQAPGRLLAPSRLHVGSPKR